MRNVNDDIRIMGKIMGESGTMKEAFILSYGQPGLIALLRACLSHGMLYQKV